MGGDLGYIPESALNQSDPALKREVLGMKAGQVSQPMAIMGKDGPRIVILKLISRESPGASGSSLRSAWRRTPHAAQVLARWLPAARPPPSNRGC